MGSSKNRGFNWPTVVAMTVVLVVFTAIALGGKAVGLTFEETKTLLLGTGGIGAVVTAFMKPVWGDK